MYFCGWVQRNRRFAFLVKADDDAFVWLSPLRDTLLRLWQDTAPAGLGTGPSGTPEGRPEGFEEGYTQSLPEGFPASLPEGNMLIACGGRKFASAGAALS